jgi:hypothetical protein
MQVSLHHREEVRSDQEMIIVEMLETAEGHHMTQETAEDHHMTQETAEDHHMTQETTEDHHMTQETAEDHHMTQETTEDHHMDKDMTPETEVRMARVEETTSEIVTIEIGMAGMVEDHLIHHKDTTFETVEDHHMDKDMTPEIEVRMARVEGTTSEIVTIEIGMAEVCPMHRDTTFETAEDHHSHKVTIEGTIAAINQICAVMHPNDKGSEYLMTDAMICTVT